MSGGAREAGPARQTAHGRGGNCRGLQGMHRGKALPVPGTPDMQAATARVCRISVQCPATAGSVQAPGIGGDAPAAALLASHDRGACPA